MYVKMLGKNYRKKFQSTSYLPSFVRTIFNLYRHSVAVEGFLKRWAPAIVSANEDVMAVFWISLVLSSKSTDRCTKVDRQGCDNRHVWA